MMLDDAIQSLRPGAIYRTEGGVITWEDESQTEPTADELADEMERLRAQRARAALDAEFEAQRDAKLQAGAPWNGKTWHTDDVFRGELNDFLLAAFLGDQDVVFRARAIDNTIEFLNFSSAKSLAAAIRDHVQAAYVECWQKKDAL